MPRIWTGGWRGLINMARGHTLSVRVLKAQPIAVSRFTAADEREMRRKSASAPECHWADKSTPLCAMTANSAAGGTHTLERRVSITGGDFKKPGSTCLRHFTQLH